MEVILKKITTKAVSDIGDFLNKSLIMISRPVAFFSGIDDSNKAFKNASMFALIASFILVIISIPSYKLNKITIDAYFIVISIGISWFLLFFSGLQLHVIAKLFRGCGTLVQSASSYFYASSVLLILKVLEIPTRVIRDEALLSAPLTAKTAENVNVSINANPNAFASELFVAIGYLWFFILIISLFKAIHGFGYLRAVVTAVLSMAALSFTVSWIQTPILHVLLNAFKAT